MPEWRDSEHPLIQTFEALDEGKTVRIWFETPAKYMSFRSMMYRYKSTMDEMLSLGDPDRKVLHFSSTKIESGEEGIIYDFKFNAETKKVKATYRIQILEDESENISTEVLQS